MIIQHVIKGIKGLADDNMAQQIMYGGIKCRWWQNNDPLPAQEIADRLTDRNLDWHQNRYQDPDPSYPSNEPFCEHTPFISTTAGAVERDEYLFTNTLTPARQIALKFATDDWKADGYLFYCYLFVLGRPSVPLQAFSEEIRELNIYTAYSAFQPEGEITAKIWIPTAQIERVEFWPLSDAQTTGSGSIIPASVRVYSNPRYVPTEDLNNIRQFLT